jgi:succinate-semialdehyde dehydrogenase / glutarate-semialdehyde dehydrogenase
LGGNAPFIIFDDADLDVAVKAVINTKFRNAGQACIASNRILVQENVYDEFAQLLAKKVSRMKCGNGMHRDSSIGEQCSKKSKWWPLDRE